ncbi:MAG: hypothetical protein CMJ12_02880 [Pelagibacterales bacterium]|nr:hypothetical protein [Pelagibacterales bacterium]PPR16335.1 MAG: Disulfide bond formation protein B [Alphaproteobacteria bacterium MarineAlpha9_Bin3]|tara:strand:- start:4152 stop:4667 length:516 start_codon:yes stop_codon:yes gene_type:complete
MDILLIRKLQNNIFNPSFISLLLAILALVFAFTLQYLFGYEPCRLCMFQRYGYTILILISIIGLFYHTNKIIDLLIIISFFTITSISFWHIGVELEWWAASLECSGMTENIGSLEEELKNINNKLNASCDQMSPKFLYISLVQWSFIYGLVSLIFSTILIINKHLKKERIT